MNETLKGVAHIGAELAAVKADLQREMERHRKTWRQLEQVTGLLRDIEDEVLLDNSTVARIQIALSQQAEPVEPAPAQEEWEAVVVVGYAYNLESGAYSQYPGADWSALMTVGQHERIVAALTRPEQAEPAPAQDERTAFEAWVMQHNTAVREDYDDTDENAPEDIRLDRQGGVYIWANAEAAWFAWKARSALDTRPAQTEQHDSDCSTNNRGVPDLLGPCDCSLSEASQ